MKDYHDFELFQNYVDDLFVTVSMKNLHNNKIVIANKSGEIYHKNDKYFIKYKWDKADTRNIGDYVFEFQLRFNSENFKKVIKLPIKNTLQVHISRSFIKSEIV